MASEFITRVERDKDEPYTVIFRTDDADKYKHIEDECRRMIGHEKPTVDAVQFKWISVNDRLPKPRFAREWYLVALESGCVESLAFERDRNEWWETGSPVTHWMELPEPPKRADGEGRSDETDR